MNTVSLFHYLLILIIRCNELLFLIILNSLFIDSLNFPSVFTYEFIRLFFSVVNRCDLGYFQLCVNQLYEEKSFY